MSLSCPIKVNNDCKQIFLIIITTRFQGPKNITTERVEINPFRLPDFAPVGEWYFSSYGYTTVQGKEIFLTEINNYFELRYNYDDNNSNNNN